jgi:hypothetical protein
MGLSAAQRLRNMETVLRTIDQRGIFSDPATRDDYRKIRAAFQKHIDQRKRSR